MIVVATDAPLSPRNLKRLAKRAIIGLGRTGSSMDNGSGDFVIAFSTAYRIQNDGKPLTEPTAFLANWVMSQMFQAVTEATEEAVYNSLFTASTVAGYDGHSVTAIPIDQVLDICRRYNVLNLRDRLPGVDPTLRFR